MTILNPAARFVICLIVLLIGVGCARPRKPETPGIDALIAEIAKPVTDPCVHDPELCTRACAQCPDVVACMKANGVCAAARTYFIDIGDGGYNPFVPGCHMKYQNHICTVNGAMFDPDTCAGDTLIEWWGSFCHLGIGDLVLIDCRELCVRMHRPGGTCEYVADVCPDNTKSARCICDPPVEPPIEP